MNSCRCSPTNRLGISAAILGCLLAGGCGSNLADVTGTVTLDGEPLAGSREVRGTVLLHPASGGPAATGAIDSEGRYRMVTGSLEGVPPGQYLATVTATQIIMPRHPEGTPSGRLIAKKAGVPLDVQPGSNSFDIELESTR